MADYLMKTHYYAADITNADGIRMEHLFRVVRFNPRGWCDIEYLFSRLYHSDNTYEKAYLSAVGEIRKARYSGLDLYMHPSGGQHKALGSRHHSSISFRAIPDPSEQNGSERAQENGLPATQTEQQAQIDKQLRDYTEQDAERI
jgi:hypothetical protein